MQGRSKSPPPATQAEAVPDGGAASLGDERNGVQVIGRAAAILRALEGNRAGLSLAELAAALGLARSTVQRIAAALQSEGLLMPAGPAGGLRLGPMIVRLAASVDVDVIGALRPLLRQLSESLDETVDLAEIREDRLVFIDQIAGTHRLRAISGVGEVFPLHCTANGKAYLAGLSDAEVQRLLGETYPRHTARTLTKWADLARELATIRKTGVAVDNEEHSEGICAAGIALSGGAASPRLVVSVPVPAARFSKMRDPIIRALKECQSRLDNALRQLG